MNKLTKSILALGLAVSMSVPVFATPVEPTSIAQSKPSYEKAWSLLRKEYYKNNTATKQAYTTLVNQCDKYGNILILDAQYYGKLNASAPLRFINSDKGTHQPIKLLDLTTMRTLTLRLMLRNHYNK